MLKSFSIFLAAACLCAGIGIVKGANPVFPYKVHQKTLENGLKAIIIPMESGGVVAYYTVVRTGSRDEYEPGHTGFAHFFEHMMFRGTEKYPSAVYDRKIIEIGANANAYTSNDITCYHLTFAAEDLETVMELESDRFMNLSYLEAAFKIEAGAVKGEYMQSLANPWFVLNEKMKDTAFDKHTYKHTVIGFGEDVDAMPAMYEYSKTFYDRYYRPENCILLIVGDVNPSQVFSRVEDYYSAWEPGYEPPQIEREPEQKGERRTSVKFSGQSLPLLQIAYKGAAFDPASREMAALMLLGDLAFGQTSDIYKRLVLDEQSVQFLGANFSASRDPDLMTVTAMIRNKRDVSRIETGIYAAFEEFKAKRVDRKRLDDLKSNLKYSFLMGLDTPGSVAGRLARFIAVTGGYEAVNELYQTIDAVTPADIQNAANKFFIKDKRTVVVLEGR
jgi:zinc protease